MGELGWEQTTTEGAVLTCFHFQLYRELMSLKTLAIASKPQEYTYGTNTSNFKPVYNPKY